MSTRTQNGTITAHNREWLLHRHIEHQIVIGQPGRGRDSYLKNLTDEQAANLETNLRSILREYGVEVSVQPVGVVDLTPEDRKRIETLDRDNYYSYPVD